MNLLRLTARALQDIIDLCGNSKIVIPAKAGIQRKRFNLLLWIPAYAGMTVSEPSLICPAGAKLALCIPLFLCESAAELSHKETKDAETTVQ